MWRSGGIWAALAVVLTTVLAVTLLGGCTAEPAQSRDAPPASAAAKAPGDEVGQTVAEVYFARVKKVRAASRPLGLAPGEHVYSPGYLERLLQVLCSGPTQDEQSVAHLRTAIPPGTQVLGVQFEDGLATVDFSAEFAEPASALDTRLRAAQVVCTLTQFPDVVSVAFRVEGEQVDTLGESEVIVGPRVDRSNFESTLPRVFVESPTALETVTTPVTIWGSSTPTITIHQIAITDSAGVTIADEMVRSEGDGLARGEWSVTMPIVVDVSGLGAITASTISPETGLPVEVMKVPVYLE